MIPARSGRGDRFGHSTIEMNQLVQALLVALVLLGGGGMAAAAPKASDLVRAELLAEPAAVRPGESFDVGIRLTTKPGWHTYWRNPGDSGLATEVSWTLPAGLTAGAIRWPTPERIPVSHLVNYGYEHEVVLLVRMDAAATLAANTALPIRADVSYLVCERECIPGEASLSLVIPVAASGETRDPDPADRIAFEAARARLPIPAPWPAKVRRDGDDLRLTVETGGLKADAIRGATFFPFDETAIENAAPQPFRVSPDGLTLTLRRSNLAGETPAALGGVLVLEEGLDSGVSRQAFEFAGPAGAAPPAPVRTPTPPTLLSILQAALLAFAGGLILNLMPCVFPVLSIKVLHLVRHSGHTPAQVRLNGIAYAAGVVASFLALAAILLVLRAGGQEIGWGFQLQSPLVVALLAFALFAVGLSLSGVVEVGASLAGMGQSWSGRSGLPGSFATGVLATIVATPCTAPFMGTAVGFALTAPPAVALAVFAALGLGLALPFLLLTFRPSLLGRLPRPGAWMEILKGALAFPIYATVAWLLFVLSQEVGPSGLLAALVGLVAVGFGAWTLRIADRAGPTGRVVARVAAVVSLLAAGAVGVAVDRDRAGAAPGPVTATAGAEPEPFTQARLDRLRDEGRAVFVNMTAAWCITCIVNERTTLTTAAVQDAFRARRVAYLKGDWTNQNPEITRLLEANGRSGVPLYVLYPGRRDPVILPQILTQGAVIESLAAIPEPKRADLNLHSKEGAIR